MASLSKLTTSEETKVLKVCSIRITLFSCNASELWHSLKKSLKLTD
jgi:hypothetical protein